MLVISLIIVVLFVVFVVWQYTHAEAISNNTIVCFTGSLGCGKTYLAVNCGVRAYRKQYIRHKLYKICPFIFKRIFKGSEYPATLYSNIPIRVGKAWSIPLKKEHILMTERLPEKAVVVIDEFGQLASQWEFNNPYVMQNLQTLVRFFRHFTDGKMFVTDQNSGNMVKPIRDRLGVIYYLNDFRRFCTVLPYFKVSCIPLLNVEDSNTRLEDELERYFFGKLPYKFQKKRKLYESRCYKYLYTENAIKDINEFDSYYTTYLPDISVSQSVEKDYKQNKDKFKDYLYNKK